MKMIIAEDLKERIRKKLGIKSLDNLLPGERAIVRLIDEMQPFEMEEWIPVGEDIPRINDTYMVTYIQNGKKYTGTARFYNSVTYGFAMFKSVGKNVWKVNEVDEKDTVEVVAWKKMPEPWSPEEPEAMTAKKIQESCDGTVYTREEFRIIVKKGGINCHDGFGHYHDGVKETEVSVFDENGNFTDILQYPFVCWYNQYLVRQHGELTHCL